jgi:hypothetical protein
MKRDEIAELYESKIFNAGREVVTEANKTGEVAGAVPKAGKSFEGEEKAKTMAKGTGPENVKEVKGKPQASKRFSSGSEKVDENKETNMLPQSEFEKLYMSTLVTENPDQAAIEPGSSDESPLEKDGFSDEEGDFDGEGEEGATEEEEVDVATELRMIIDRLTEIAEKLGAYDEEEGMEGGEEGLEGEEAMGDEMGAEPPPVGESHVELKPLPDTKAKMQGKGNMKVKSKFNPDGGSAAKAGPGKGAADGKLKPLSKGKFGPTMSMKADTSSAMGKQGASLFGSK